MEQNADHMGEFNIKSSTLEKSLDLAKGFLQRLVGPSVDELGLLFSDNVKLWRLKNQIRNLEKIRKIVENEKVVLKQINLKVLVPYLEGVSLEENEKLQEMWANLFVNYIDVNKNLTSHVYPNVLKQLSSREVEILELGSATRNICIGRKYFSKIESKEIRIEGYDLSNLERLGLLKELVKISRYGEGSQDYEEIGSDDFYLTSFAFDFCKACTRDNDSKSSE